jgi:predicted hydrocarbon binding protein
LFLKIIKILVQLNKQVIQKYPKIISHFFPIVHKYTGNIKKNSSICKRKTFIIDLQKEAIIMKKDIAAAIEEETQTDEFQVPAFGYELIREILLDDILGKDSFQILYWAGKQLARKFPLNGEQEVVAFFQNAGWGHLEIIKQSKTQMELLLTGDLISRRLDFHPDCHFQLEAGFLAEQFTQQRKYLSEASEEIKHRAKKVTFTIQWDPKDPI